jgi:hypothetical protein
MKRILCTPRLGWPRGAAGERTFSVSVSISPSDIECGPERRFGRGNGNGRNARRIAKNAWIATIALAVATGTLWAEQPLDKDLRLFMEYFEGEFNNHNQVNFETNDFLDEQTPEAARHPWHHHTVRRVDAPAFGEYVFFAQINEEGPDGAVIRQRVHVLDPDYASGTIRQRFSAIEAGQEGVDYPLEPAALAALSPDALRSYPEGCQIVWRRQVDQFLGTIARGECAVESRRSGNILYIWAEMVLSKNEMWHMEGGTDQEFNPIFGPPGGVPFKLRRVDYFSCWVAFLKDEENDDWDLLQDVHIHDQGGIAEFATTHEEPRRYRLQLMQTVFPAGTRPDVLELFVYEQGKEKALSYTWTAPDSERIGINLRWMQAGCAAER